MRHTHAGVAHMSQHHVLQGITHRHDALERFTDGGAAFGLSTRVRLAHESAGAGALAPFGAVGVGADETCGTIMMRTWLLLQLKLMWVSRVKIVRLLFCRTLKLN